VFINGKINSARGASFCQVHKIKQLIQFIEVIVEGNQKWHGAAPSLSRRLVTKMYCISVWFLRLFSSILEYSIIAEPRACARKYLMALSVSWLVCVCSINGMNDNRLISIEIQANNQFVLDSAIIVLITKNNEKSRDEGRIIATRVWRS
jgi:hypothetical protein